MITQYRMSALLALILLASPLAEAGKPDGKPGPGGTRPPPNPDIVYMSANSRTVNGPAIRGFTFQNNTDTELAKAKNGRGKGSIAWSPDGRSYAWIEIVSETSSILTAAPGQAPRVIYSAQWGDASRPYPGGYNSDQLAWGPGCSPGTSVLVFQGYGGPNLSPQGIYAIDSPDPEGAPPVPRLVLDEVNASAFAISSDGKYLAFDNGYGTGEKVWLVPLCSTPSAKVALLEWDDFGAAVYRSACDDDPTTSACDCDGNPEKQCIDYPSQAVISIDWSRDNSRLALSVVVGPDPDYPWRDLRIAYLNYSTSGLSTASVLGVKNIKQDSAFGAASSEHSPQWGPSSGEACQRIAFSQSAGASDGSSINGRRLFLMDVSDWLGTESCQIETPLELGAREPRAIDWK